MNEERGHIEESHPRTSPPVVLTLMRSPAAISLPFGGVVAGLAMRSGKQGNTMVQTEMQVIFERTETHYNQPAAYVRTVTVSSMDDCGLRRMSETGDSISWRIEICYYYKRSSIN